MIDNSWSEYLYSLKKETPAKTWFYAKAMHPAIFRALRMDKSEDGAIFAAMPFRLHQHEEKHLILSAHPCPPFFDERGNDWLGIEYVIAWNPVDDTAFVLGDDSDQLAGSTPSDTPTTIYASPFAFLRAYAEARAAWHTQCTYNRTEWHQMPREPDLTPGYLLIGQPDKVRWPVHDLPEHFHTQGIDARAVNAAMLRQAKIPRATSLPTDNRIAA